MESKAQDFVAEVFGNAGTGGQAQAGHPNKQQTASSYVSAKLNELDGLASGLEKLAATKLELVLLPDDPKESKPGPIEPIPNLPELFEAQMGTIRSAICILIRVENILGRVRI